VTSNQTLDQTIADLVASGALFAVNHSGGKDSQAMLIRLLDRVPARQLVVVHADLGDVEWQGTQEHARRQAEAAGLPFLVATAVTSFFGMVERRFATRPDAPSFPSAKHRQCTSDLKRGPIDREVRRYAKANGFSTVVNCIGIRAAESSARSKLQPLKTSTRNSVAGRAWFDLLPIFDLTTDQVFATIRDAGQEPHWAYAAGNERLSCVFCIMGSSRDLANGARHNPALLDRFVALEQRTGYTMHMSQKPLLQLIEEGKALLDQPAPANQVRLLCAA
jgi:3'-phosphoadenosine 5'-phosphosulfate sulfotransferase (PAPS reductase)/FAD synthetase